MPLPEGSLSRLVPSPGLILVERDEAAETYGSLIVPNSYRNRQRKVTGTVFASSHDDFEKGDRVLLAPGAGRRIVVGHTPLYAVEESSILAKLWDADIEETKRAEMAPLRKPAAARLVEEGRSEQQPEKREERVG